MVGSNPLDAEYSVLCVSSWNQEQWWKWIGEKDSHFSFSWCNAFWCSSCCDGVVGLASRVSTNNCTRAESAGVWTARCVYFCGGFSCCCLRKNSHATFASDPLRSELRSRMRLQHRKLHWCIMTMMWFSHVLPTTYTHVPAWLIRSLVELGILLQMVSALHATGIR